MKWVFRVFLGLMVLAASATGQEAEAILYGSGPSVEPGQPDLIYRIDRESGIPEEIGGVGASGCRGLVFDLQGRLLTACPRGDDFVLQLIDPDSGALQGGPVLERRFRGSFLDLAFRPADQVLATLEVPICEICDPPPPPSSAVALLEPADGSQLRLVFAGTGSRTYLPVSPVGFRDGKLYGIRTNSGGDSSLLLIDLINQTLGPPTALSLDGSYNDLAFDPQSGTAFAVLSDGDSSSLLATIDEAGQVEVVANLTADIRFIAFSRPLEPPPVTELIFPVMTLPASEERYVSAMLTVLNQADSAALATIQLFDDGGVRHDPASNGPACPVEPNHFVLPPAEHFGELFLVPGRQSAHVILEGSRGPFSGWVRLRRVGVQELQAEMEIFHLQQPRFFGPCFPHNSFPSEVVLTSASLPAVRPALEFTAVGTIGRYRESGFAIVNPSSSETARISIQADELDGQPYDSNEIELAPRQRLTLLLFDLLNYGKQFLVPPQRPAFFEGPVRFSSDIPIAVGALNVQLPDGKWVSLPVVSR